MKIPFQILFYLLISFSCVAQDEKDSAISKIALGFNVSSTYKIGNGGASGNFKYAFDVYSRFNLNKKVKVNIGIAYDILQDHSSISLNYYNIMLHRKNERQYSFLSIPASLCFEINKQKMKPFIGFGLQGSVLVQNRFISDDEIFHENKKLFNNGIFCAFADFRFGFIYKMSPRLDLALNISYYSSFIPLVRQYTNQLGENVSEKVNLNYFRGSVGILYHFK